MRMQSKILMKDRETEARPQRFAVLLLLAETSTLAQHGVERCRGERTAAL